MLLSATTKSVGLDRGTNVGGTWVVGAAVLLVRGAAGAAVGDDGEVPVAGLENVVGDEVEPIDGAGVAAVVAVPGVPGAAVELPVAGAPVAADGGEVVVAPGGDGVPLVGDGVLALGGDGVAAKGDGVAAGGDGVTTGGDGVGAGVGAGVGGISFEALAERVGVSAELIVWDRVFRGMASQYLERKRTFDSECPLSPPKDVTLKRSDLGKGPSSTPEYDKTRPVCIEVG